MAVTSIPKSRLVNLIVEELQAVDQALAFFHIQPSTDVELRLMAFTKDELLIFILQMGVEGEQALSKLQTEFPLRRPPTLYLSVVERRPSPIQILRVSHSLSEQGIEGGINFDSNDTVRFIYLPQNGVSRFIFNKIPVLEFQLHYEYRFEFVQSDRNAEDYGQISVLYSLETAFIWLPVAEHDHAIIACSDYPAIRRIRDFLEIKLGIELNPPWLNQEMLEKITGGSVPRSVTYTLQPLAGDANDVQNITIADPQLETKNMFHALMNNPDREQVSGFYSYHPGLALGGIGVARRDGKVWTPRRLDRREILDLSLAIIHQTESELANTKDISILAKYYYANRVRIGEKEIQGDAKETWVSLLPLVLQAYGDEKHFMEISPKIISRLVQYQKPLKLITAVDYECPTCHVNWLAKCSECHELLSLEFSETLHAICPKCKTIYQDHFTCFECGTEIDVLDFINQVRILPEDESNKSIEKAARKFPVNYHGTWGIRGQMLWCVDAHQQTRFPRLSLEDFNLWRNQARIRRAGNRSLTPDATLKVLNKSREKCWRDDTPPSTAKCGVCTNNPIDPKWITSGQVCLLRLFGIPIAQSFDGIHHGNEIADLRYEDILLNSGQQVHIGIHVKSRNMNCKPEGMGRSSQKIEGLYKQVMYSAFEASVKGENIQVIGIAIPNNIKADVVDSMAYAVNTLGFSFLVIDEEDWQSIITIAYEQATFDFNQGVG